MGHSKFSPSGADRWMRCTASFFEHENDSSSSTYAREGTDAHTLAADVLTGKEVLKNWRGKRYSADLLLNAENYRALEFYINEVQMLPMLHHSPKILIEKQLGKGLGVWGTADHQLVSLSRYDLTDLKFGKGVMVEAEDNFQLLSYLSLGIKINYEDQGLNPPPDMCVRIIQPRSRSGDYVREHLYSLPDLMAFRQSQSDRVKEIRQGIVSYHASPKSCQWCSAAKNGCRAYNEMMLEKAGADFAQYIDAEEEEIMPPTSLVPKLSDEELLTLFHNRKELVKYAEAIEAAAIKRQIEGAGYPLDLVQSNTHFKIIDEDVLDRLLQDANLERKDYTDEKFLSPSRIRTLIKKFDPDLQEKIEACFYQPPGDARLVPPGTKGRPYEQSN